MQKSKRIYTAAGGNILHITEKTYQNYELMTREPKIEILIRIADLYEVSIDYLVGRVKNKK